jgi:hypothetical protein
MLAPLTIESINITDNWHCECNDPGCHLQVSLDPDTGRMLLENKWLVLIVEGCQWRHRGEMVKEGEGFRIYRLE